MNCYADFFPIDLQPLAKAEADSRYFESNGVQVHYLHRAADSPYTVVAVHGAGGHAGALWPFVAATNNDAVAIDLPLYGQTLVPDRTQIRYETWVQILVEFTTHWHKPVLLFGASIGGILAAEVANKSDNVKQVVVTCLMESGRLESLALITNFGVFGAISPLLLPMIRGRIAHIEIPMYWVARFSRMSRNRALSRLCRSDPYSGQVTVPLGFLKSLLTYRHHIAAAKTTLAHPAKDAWTPLRLSLKTTPAKVLLLENCGHFPVESPGIEQLIAVLSPASL